MRGRSYSADVRSTEPNVTGHRRDRFRQGWRNAVEGREYGSPVLNELTWDNLGYRLGRIFGETHPILIDVLYDWCVKQQEEHLAAEPT